MNPTTPNQGSGKITVEKFTINFDRKQLEILKRKLGLPFFV